MKTPDPDLAGGTAGRLNAIKEELTVALDLETVDDLADLMGVSRNTLSNWLLGYHPPTIHAMIRLCDRYGFTLDWIYRNRSEGLSYDKLVRLTARLEGVSLSSPAPEPAASPSLDLEKLDHKKAAGTEKKPLRKTFKRERSKNVRSPPGSVNSKERPASK